MKLPVYDIEHKQVEEIEAPERMFSASWNPTLVHQALLAQEANSRNSVAHAKDRSEVRGGGKKPWRQKGTGRARHGSIRSPLWIGGGVAHGPRSEKDYSVKINKKMKTNALFSLLSKRLQDEQLEVIDVFVDAKNAKTRAAAATLSKMLKPRQSVTLVLADANKSVYLTTRNLKKVACVAPTSLNIRDIAKSQKVVFEKAALLEAVNHFITKDKKQKTENKKAQ